MFVHNWLNLFNDYFRKIIDFLSQKQYPRGLFVYALVRMTHFMFNISVDKPMANFVF
jgi:hypothetical protein